MKTAFRPFTIGSRLATIADRLAGKTAITEGDTQVSYRELDAAASTIARRIVVAGRDRPGSSVFSMKTRFPRSRRSSALLEVDERMFPWTLATRTSVCASSLRTVNLSLCSPRHHYFSARVRLLQAVARSSTLPLWEQIAKQLSCLA